MSGYFVDMKLVLLVNYLDGKIVINDYNFNKVVKFYNVFVINLNDIVNVLKFVFFLGEYVKVKVVKLGEELG